MKNVLSKNCFKKVKTSAQRKTMEDIGMNTFVDKKPKLQLGMHRVQKTKIMK